MLVVLFPFYHVYIDPFFNFVDYIASVLHINVTIYIQSETVAVSFTLFML